MKTARKQTASKQRVSDGSAGSSRLETKTVSAALKAAHETAKGLHRAGVIDKTTMKEFDVLCLPKVPAYTPSQIRQIRMRCHASQAVFARCINVSPSALQKWEIGAKKPGPLARKLLHLVDRKGLEILMV